jgi:hypothetical protein
MRLTRAAGFLSLGLTFAFLGALLAWAAPDRAATRSQAFDVDPQWDGHNNRLGAGREPVKARQDFGFSPTRRAGGAAAGEVGGYVTPAAEPALYAAPLTELLTLETPLSAAGKLAVPRGGGNVLVGFFNRGALNEWRTPSTFVLRVNARGDEGFHVHVEYCTARWRAGADFFGAVDAATGRKSPVLFAPDVSHAWSIRYDPAGNDGGGAIRATLGDQELAFNLDPGHKSDGASFDRFGILNVLKSHDGGGEIWLDDLDVNGTRHGFDVDPGWDALGNRREYETRNLRPWFDFGFSPTNFAGGAAAGEVGGLLFRGDRRYPDRLAHYGDALGDLTMDDPLEAGGRVCLRRGVTDSTVLIGFYHAADSVRVLDSQKSGFPENFLGVAIEGPSRDGFFFYPVYNAAVEGTGAYAKSGDGPPQILPDGASHAWSMRYDPAAGADGQGRVTVTLDGKSVALDVSPEHRRVGARFNRFGFVTTHIDGNGQEVFLDDLTYTAGHAKR